MARASAKACLYQEMKQQDPLKRTTGPKTVTMSGTPIPASLGCPYKMSPHKTSPHKRSPVTKRQPTKRHLAQNITSTKRHQKTSPVTKRHLSASTQLINLSVNFSWI